LPSRPTFSSSTKHFAYLTQVYIQQSEHFYTQDLKFSINKRLTHDIALYSRKFYISRKGKTLLSWFFGFIGCKRIWLLKTKNFATR
jgi:hypothetical protein